jgi:hypothetical protein
MKPIKVNWTQIKNVLVAEVVDAPKNMEWYSRDDYTLEVRVGRPQLIAKVFDLGTNRGAACLRCDSESCANEARERFQSLIDEYNREHEEPEKIGEPKIRIAEIYTDPPYQIPVVDSPNKKGISIWAVVMDPNFAGYEVRYPDGTKHTVATPFVFVNDEGDWSIESDDEYRHKSTLTGIAFWEDE